jgi:hypothetical protein
MLIGVSLFVKDYIMIGNGAGHSPQTPAFRSSDFTRFYDKSQVVFLIWLLLPSFFI